jgi:hypothetical protein
MSTKKKASVEQPLIIKAYDKGLKNRVQILNVIGGLMFLRRDNANSVRETVYPVLATEHPHIVEVDSERIEQQRGGDREFTILELVDGSTVSIDNVSEVVTITEPEKKLDESAPVLTKKAVARQAKAKPNTIGTSKAKKVEDETKK